MELKAIDNSRVTILTSVTRPSGQLYLPVAAYKLLERYKFQKGPTAEELLGAKYSFRHGVFEDTAIDEFSIYEDGFVVAARSNTSLLESFVADALKWAEEELDLRETNIPPKERHFERYLIVSLKIKPERALPGFAQVTRSLSEHQVADGLHRFQFDFAAVSYASDTTMWAGRKPLAFTIGRRINVPFEAGIYYSTAPLKTQDHLDLLNHWEKLFT